MRHRMSRFLAIPTLSVITFAGALPAHALPAPVLGPTGAPGTYAEQNIGATLFGDAATYRIPALADLGDGVVLAAWDGRPYNAADAPNPNSIVMRRSTDYGATWSETYYIAKGQLPTAEAEKYGYSDPSFVVDRETGKVFAFFVYSQDTGFHWSDYGNDIKNDRTVMGAVVSESTDGGLTWSEPRDITPIAKPGTSKTDPQPGDVRSTFATSGEGIQLKYGQYKGRLIQQFAGKVLNADGTESLRAYSLYSDDHGKTWQRGDFVGIGMDENKTVELSDGRVMLNSRDSSNSRFRKVAISSDGGQSWGPVTLDTELPDPTNNASIIRMYPDAPQGSKAAQKLIFTNSNNGVNGDRKNLTARVSCDDGETWPGIRQFKTGFGAYSSATALSNGAFGVLYEASYQTDIRYGTFDQEWLNVVCAPLSAAPVSVVAGESVSVPVTITNQEDTAVSGTVTLADNSAFTGNQSEHITVAPGESTTVTLTLSAVEAARSGSIDAVFTGDDGKQSRYTIKVTATGDHIVFGAKVSSASADTRDVTVSPYTVGEKITYNFSVTNTSDEPVNVVPVGGNMDTGFLPPAPGEASRKNCRYNRLASGATYKCSAQHTVTQEDVDRGYFVPELSFNVLASADTSRSVELNYTGERVVLVASVAPEPAPVVPEPEPEPTAPTEPVFSDVEPDNMFFTEIQWVAQQGIAQGWPDGTYRPLADIERGAMAAYIFRFAAPQDYQAPEVSPFEDVPTTHQFYREIAWMHEAGIAHGWEDGTFRPQQGATRDAIAAFFYRLSGAQEYQAPATSPFADVSTEHPFYTEIAWLAEQKVSTGWPDGTYRPDQPTQRDAIAAFLYRFDRAFAEKK